MSIEPISLPDRPRILVIVLRRIGDVLLTTPLIRSVRKAWPAARLDALVFSDTAGILTGNRDVDELITMPARPSLSESLKTATYLVRRYDLAISTQTGDRPTLYALLAAPRAIAPVEDRFSGRLKQKMLNRSIPFDGRAHRVEVLLRLADALGIARQPEIVVPESEVPPLVLQEPFAVLHASPMFNYKRWTAQGWRALCQWLIARGLKVYASGGPGDTERRYLDDIWQGIGISRLDGQYSWAQTAALLAKASVYVGPDTSVTHLAAAAGCPTVALYGPTDPRLWGPWPRRGLSETWAAAGAVQHRGNVWLVQHVFPCTPCQLEGCERSLASESECLRSLAPEQVIAAAEQALASGRSND